MAITPTPLIERFLSKAIPEPNSGCWLWEGDIQRNGYGRICLRTGKKGGKNALAHRVAYELFCSPIPPGEGYHGTVVRHRCDNRACVNPQHLELGSIQDNVADRVARGRTARGERGGASLLTEAQALAIIQDPRGCVEVGREYGVSKSTVMAIRSGQNWGHLGARPKRVRAEVDRRGSRNAAAKLTDDDVRTIRASGETAQVLAARYGMTPTAIYNLLNGKTWRHVE